nr:ArsR family transcriptional regulator [Hymenobacter sp. IS2118]
MAILQLLARRQSCVCGELVTELPLPQSTLSQHLKQLKAAGLGAGRSGRPARVLLPQFPAAGWYLHVGPVSR